MKKTKKVTQRIMVSLMCVSMALVQVPAKKVEAAEIINPNPLIDVIVNPCADYSGTYLNFEQDLADKIAQKLNEKRTLYTNDGDDSTDPESVPDINDVRISQAGIQLDTTDLADWYVYDHYDTAFTDGTNWNSYNGRKPYFSYTNTQNATVKQTIEQAVSSGYINRPIATYQTPGNVSTIDRHILSTVDDYGKASMTFVGYGDKPYNDFLLYPASTRYKKHISFDVDASMVRIHSMSGAGFLINSGIDSNGKLQGYLLYFKYTQDSTGVANGANVYLYRLNGTQTPEDIHNGTTLSCSTVSTTTLNLNKTTKKTKVTIDISTDYVTVQEQPYESSSSQGLINTLFNNVCINNESYPYTNYNGFGPYVGYTSHGCTDTSYFIFSDLVMSYQTDSFEAVRNSQFAKDRADTTVDRYFINLADYTADIPELASEYNEGIRRLTDDKIKYVSNVKDSTDVSGKATSVLDNLGASNTYYASENASYEKYVDEFADYIVNSTGWDDDAVDAPDLVAPAAKFTIVGKDKNTDSQYVQTLSIHQKHLADMNQTVNITFKDESYPVDSSRPIAKWEYTIRDTNGIIRAQKTVSSIDKDKTPPSIDITTSSAEGDYTMTLLVTDSQGVVSTSSTLYFSVLNDSTAPSATIAADPDNMGKAIVTITDAGSGVKSYKLNSKDEEAIEFTSVRAEAKVTVDIPQNGSNIIVLVYDECGNERVVTFTTKKITYYEGLSDDTTIYDTRYVVTNTKVSVFPDAPVDSSGNYGFVGWFTTDKRDTPFLASQIITDATSVYGKWNSEKVTVTFNPNGGTIVDVPTDSKVQVPTGTLLSNAAALVNTPTKQGYDFAGWKIGSTTGAAIGTSSADSDTVLYATWTPGKVILTLDPNGGVRGSRSQLEATNGSTIQSILTQYGTGNTNPSKAGYIFSKWQISNGAGGYRDITSEDKIGDTGATIYALWTRDAMQFTTKNMATGKYATAYNDSTTATNGTNKFKYYIVEDSALTGLPEGLSLNEDTGAITGVISGEVKTYTFKVKAVEQPNQYVLETSDSITQSFSITVSTGSRPVVTDSNIALKADASDKEAVIKALYEDVVGVTNVNVGTPADTQTGKKYPVTIYFSSNCGGESQTVYVNASEINPELEFNVESIPAISALSPENASASTLMEYLNSAEYRVLKLKDTGNDDYNSALGTGSTSYTIPEYTFSDESSTPSAKTYDSKGNQYSFSKDLLGNTLTRTLTVNPVILSINAETIRKWSNDAAFTPDFIAGVTDEEQITEVEGSKVDYSIATESLSDGVVSIDDNVISIEKVGTTHINATGSKEYYTTGVSVFNIIVNAKPGVTTGSATTDADEVSATLNGTVKLGTEDTAENGLVSRGFKFKRSEDDSYSSIAATDIDGNKLSVDVSDLEVGTEYSYMTYCETLTGVVEGTPKTFTLQADAKVTTDSADSITSSKASLHGYVQSGKVSEKGFEYRVKTDSTFIKVPLLLSDSTDYNISGLLPSTTYQYRAYALVDGVAVYGDIKEFTTANIVTRPEVGVKVVGDDTVLYPAEDSKFYVVLDSDDEGIQIDYLDVEGVNPKVQNIATAMIGYVDDSIDTADEANDIHYDNDLGYIVIGPNIKSVDIEVNISNGDTVIIHVVRGLATYSTENQSTIVTTDVDSDSLKTCVNSKEIEEQVISGNTVDIKLYVSDMTPEESITTGLKDYAKENINSYSHLIYVHINVKKIINGDTDAATEITHLERPVFIELDIDPATISSAKDLRVLHKKSTGEIEILNVVKEDSKIGFYVQDFSPYAIVYVNQYSVGYNVTGEGSVTPSREDLSLLEGENINFSIVPAKYYHIDSLTDNGVEVKNANAYAINGIDKNHTFNVNFKKDQFQIKAEFNKEFGTITHAGTTYVDAQDSITYNFTPKAGYIVKNVYIDGVDIGGNIKEYKFPSITEAHTIKVVFEKEPVIATTNNEVVDVKVIDSSSDNLDKSAKTSDDFVVAIPVIFIALSLIGAAYVYSNKKKFFK